MEDQTPEVNEDLGTGGKFKNWLQDNIRIIISVLIVIAIAGGIYSYSKRGEESINEEEIAVEEITEGEAEGEETAVTVIGEEEEDTVSDVTEKEIAVEEKDDVKIDEATDQSLSEETEDAFVETAVKGDSKTTMARRALKDYLEKNQDSSLTAEHKIYIEDYLRRQVSLGKVNVGSEISFSKSQIKDAIEKSKTLNENQLNNLKKYSARVSNI